MRSQTANCWCCLSLARFCARCTHFRQFCCKAPTWNETAEWYSFSWQRLPCEIALNWNKLCYKNHTNLSDNLIEITFLLQFYNQLCQHNADIIEVILQQESPWSVVLEYWNADSSACNRSCVIHHTFVAILYLLVQLYIILLPKKKAYPMKSCKKMFDIFTPTHLTVLGTWPNYVT